MKKTHIISIIFSGIFLLIGIALLFDKLSSFDSFIYGLIPRTEGITLFMRFITRFANVRPIIVLTILFAAIFYKKKKSLWIILNSVCFSFLIEVIKIIVKRPRPEYAMFEEKGYSFPSGHSITAVAFYGLIMYSIYNSNIKKVYKKIMTIVISILILLIGISRAYLGVHHPSDVIAGFSISIAYLILYIKIFNQKENSI